MIEQEIEYQSKGLSHKGVLVYNETYKGKRPAVIVAHAWKGRDSFAIEKARFLAKLGYAGFAADLYGAGKVVESNEDAFALMLPLFLDRKLLRERIVSAYEAVSHLDPVDSSKIGVIGFCFGGTAALELLRSGKKLSGTVTFHGLMGYKVAENTASIYPAAKTLYGKLLILHGYLDPLVSAADLSTIQQEFTDKHLDWQMHIYGRAAHAFTNPQANDKNLGLIFQPDAERRAFHSMRYFFEEVFI